MGAWRATEVSRHGWPQSSPSEISVWLYFLLIAILFFLGKLLYKKSIVLEGALASYCRIAMVLLSVLLVYAIYMVGLIWNIPFEGIPDHVREGVFGDSFGTINALFSGLAFAGVLITLLFQRKDLSETREQINRQQIESQFYIMLSHQQELVRSFDVQRKEDNEVIARGRDCFREWVEALSDVYGVCVERKLAHPRRLSYQAVYIAARTDLGVYFRSLYSVFRYIDDSGHEESQKLSVIVRSLISDYELVLLFYNCLSEKGEKFCRYVERFALFDNLDESLLLNEWDLHRFAVEAYGGNLRLIEKRQKQLNSLGKLTAQNDDTPLKDSANVTNSVE